MIEKDKLYFPVVNSTEWMRIYPSIPPLVYSIADFNSELGLVITRPIDVNSFDVLYSKLKGFFNADENVSSERKEPYSFLGFLRHFFSSLFPSDEVMKFKYNDHVEIIYSLSNNDQKLYGLEPAPDKIDETVKDLESLEGKVIRVRNFVYCFKSSPLRELSVVFFDYDNVGKELSLALPKMRNPVEYESHINSLFNLLN